MIVQNKPNSTNFGSITKFKVRAQDVEHFQNNIHKKFKPGENIVFSENLLHETLIGKLTSQENFNAIHLDLKNRGFNINDSFRLNSEDKHVNIYLVNERKDIKKITKKTAGIFNQVKYFFHMIKNATWANAQIKPQTEFEKQAAGTLTILKFTDEASADFEKFAKKNGAKEFNYVAKKDGGIDLKSDANRDGIKFKMQVKDAETFFDTTFERINSYLEKKNKSATYVLENPRYNEFEENYENLRFGHWASQNLRNKGFDVAIPKGEDPNKTVDLYFLTTDEAQKKLQKKFDGPKGFLGFVADSIKANFNAKYFSRMVGGAENDIHYKDAATFLYEHDLNAHQNNRFQKLVGDMNFKEIEYKPKDNE